MWLLSYIGDGDGVLEGKRLWLRPGSGHLFGRTSSKPTTGERCFYIGEKNVSRKHTIFHVAQSSLGSSTRLQERTKVTISDESKKGTIIDGEKLVQGKKVVDGSKGSYRVQLADTEHVFKLEWRDVVLSFTSISRGAKKTGTALAEEKQKFEGCDVKLSTEYVTNKTTHVIAKKRNTSSGLQALVQGRWLVAASWLDALAEVVKRKSQDETGPLEEDFDANWPKEVDFIVPASGETNPRPNDYLKPDPERAEVFQDYNFIFLSQTQYESLLPVILGGGGKAVHMEFQPGQTTADDVLDFAKTLSGNKNSRQFLLSQEPGPGGIVIVRIGDKDNREEMKPLMDDLSITLNQRTIEQSELLDAILMKDASEFRRPLRDPTQSARPDQTRQQETPTASSSFPRPPKETPIEVRGSPAVESQRALRSGQNPPQTQQDRHQPEEPPAEAPPPTRRRNRRIITQARKINFDDFDPSLFAAPESSVQAISLQEPSQAASVHAMDVDESVAEASNTQQTSHKRPAEEDLVKEEGIDEKMFPGMAAMKRRKTNALKRGKGYHGSTTEPEVSVVASKAVEGKKPKTESAADIKARIKKRREEEEEARRKDEEAYEEAVTTDLEKMKVDVAIEEFDPPAAPPVDNLTQVEMRTSQNPAWNGRANFKNFRSNKRPRNGGALERPETQRVIISLEEIPSKSQGLGDEYWLENGHDHERRRGNKSQSKSQSQRASQAPASTAPRQSGAAGFGGTSLDEDDSTAFRRRLERSREEDHDEDVITEQLDPHATSTQTQGRTQKKKKRGLDDLLGESGLPPAKKPRVAAGKSKAAVQKARTAAAMDLDEEEEDDDDDPMAFRRKRR